VTSIKIGMAMPTLPWWRVLENGYAAQL